MKTELPKSVTRKELVHLRAGVEWRRPPYDLHLFSGDMSGHGYILIGETTVTFDVPQVDFIAAQISSIEKTKAAIVREYEEKLSQIDAKLGDLRSLAFDGATVLDAS